mgnify:FL=1
MDKDQNSGSTHQKAIALEYHPGEDQAPRVTAIGSNHLADRIIALAQSQHIPIHQDPYLAEALSKVQLTETIPPDLYVLVAEILAFVYRIHLNRNKPK